MKAVRFYFSNLEPTQNPSRFVLPFSPFTFMVDLTFCKICKIYGKSHSR